MRGVLAYSQSLGKTQWTYSFGSLEAAGQGRLKIGFLSIREAAVGSLAVVCSRGPRTGRQVAGHRLLKGLISY